MIFSIKFLCGSILSFFFAFFYIFVMFKCVRYMECYRRRSICCYGVCMLFGFQCCYFKSWFWSGRIFKRLFGLFLVFWDRFDLFFYFEFQRQGVCCSLLEYYFILGVRIFRVQLQQFQLKLFLGWIQISIGKDFVFLQIKKELGVLVQFGIGRREQGRVLRVMRVKVKREV